MTLLHLVNCLLLTYAPYVIIYRSTELDDTYTLLPHESHNHAYDEKQPFSSDENLFSHNHAYDEKQHFSSDESLFGSCVMAGVFFITTQLVKTFILATFMIIPEETEVHSLAAVPVILVNMLDYLAIYMMHGWLQKKAKPNHLRILAVALGWAGAEAIVHYLIPLWIGARDIEFSWEYIEMGLLSNINILLHLSASTAVWLGMRNDLGPLGMSVVAITCTGQLILSAFGNHMKKSLALGFSSCSVLGMHFTIAISLFALVGINYTIYTKRTETTNSQQRW